MSEGVYWDYYGQVVFAECPRCDHITAHHATYVGYRESCGWRCGGCGYEKFIDYTDDGSKEPSWDEGEVFVTLKQYNELAERIAKLEEKLCNGEEE